MINRQIRDVPLKGRLRAFQDVRILDMYVRGHNIV